MARKDTSSAGADSVTEWLDDASKDFFSTPAQIDKGTIVKAVIGFGVVVIGVVIITLQALGSV